MAEVYRALSLGAHGFEKLVALKRVLPAYASDPEFVERLIDEANLAVQLAHTNIVQILDFGYMDESLYIAMELVEGLDLRAVQARIRRARKAVEPELAVAICVEILRGLEFAHARSGSDGRPLGIVHCDVSPSNVLVSWAGEVKLTDFGIARANAPRRVSLEGIVAGKTPYMAPEQFEGGRIDRRADVWAVGIVLYELLVGRRPYEGDKESILAAARAHSFALPSAIGRELPAALDAPIRAALAPDPADRPASAGAMLRALVDARRAAGLEDDPLLVGERMRELAGDAPRSGEQALEEAVRETAVRSLLVTAKAAPHADAGGPEAALPTRATRAVSVPVGRGRRRTAVAVSVSILAVAAAAFALTRFGTGDAPSSALAPGRFAAPRELADVAKRAEATLARSLEALPPPEAGAAPARITGRIRPAGAGARVEVVAVVGARTGRAFASGPKAELPDQVPAVATRALAQALGRPVLLPGPHDVSVASAHAYNEAVLILVRGRVVRAMNRLDDLLALEPDFDEALYLRVMAAWLGTAATNAASLSRARERFAGDPRRLALVEVAELFVTRRYAEAAAAAERSLATLGDDPDLELFLGEALVRGGDFDAGLAHLRSLRTRSPYIGMLAYRGAYHALAVDDGEDLRAWLAAMRVTDPSSPTARTLEAQWTIRHGSTEEIARLAERSDLAWIDSAGEIRLELTLLLGESTAVRRIYSDIALGAEAPGDRARAALNLARLDLVEGHFRDRQRWLDLARRADPTSGGMPVAAQAALAGALDAVESARALAAVTDETRELDAAVLAAAAGGASPAEAPTDREIRTTIDGLAKARAGDRAGARQSLSRAARAPTDGTALPLAGFLRAWLARTDDPREVVEGCNLVLRPPATPVYVAALFPRCLRWTAAAQRELGDAEGARETDRRLAKLWSRADRPIAWLDEPPFRLVP